MENGHLATVIQRCMMLSTAFRGYHRKTFGGSAPTTTTNNIHLMAIFQDNSVLTGRMPFLPPNQQHQSIEGTRFSTNKG